MVVRLNVTYRRTENGTDNILKIVRTCINKKILKIVVISLFK